MKIEVEAKVILSISKLAKELEETPEEIAAEVEQHLNVIDPLLTAKHATKIGMRFHFLKVKKVTG